jgi:signal transduction histidine kinase
MQSLRTKVYRTYAYSKLVLLAFATVVFIDLYVVDRQIGEGEAVADFRESVLEMRRDEKNLFLYGALSSLDQLLLHQQTAQVALASGRDAFAKVGGTDRVREIEAALRAYGREVDEYAFLEEERRVRARETIRDLGHDLAEASQEMSRRERETLAKSIRRARLTLLLAFAGVVVLGFVGGFFLVRGVVQPLRRLEEGLSAIDAGRARELPLPSQDQEIRSFVTAFNAMLKRMRRQQDQTRRNEKAAALGLLVSGVAHELNNPLSNISTSAQLLLEEGDDADPELQQLWLSQIDSETERARRIVRRLLDSVRQPRVRAQRQALDDVIDSAVALLDRQLSSGTEVTVGEIADLEVAVDRERLQQVLINLIKNAADAGARHVRVGADLATWDDRMAEADRLEGDPATVSHAERAVRIAVEDDGPGIPPDLLEHVFDPFVTTRSGGEGTGLGLYLVAEIVSEHGGCILVGSPATGGTRFCIWLPVTDEEAS